jgi:nucleoside diphosphate kinase
VREILGHFQQEEMVKKNQIQRVVEKFKKRGINISACKSRASLSLVITTECDSAKKLFQYNESPL